MTPRKRRAPQPEYRPGMCLNWNSPAHWNWAGMAPCRYCGKDAFCMDSGRHPAHKVCAEAALREQADDAAAAYARQTL